MSKKELSALVDSCLTRQARMMLVTLLASVVCNKVGLCELQTDGDIDYMLDVVDRIMRRDARRKIPCRK